MKTEQAIMERRGEEVRKVSRALQELAPLVCNLVDHQGKRVPLSSAGYVLRSGGKYRLRITTPFKPEELAAIEVINKPEFVNVDPELTEYDETGQKVHTIPFRVQTDLGASLMRLGTLVRCDEVEVTFRCQPGSGQCAPSYSCPIVVRPGWMLIAFAAVAGIVSLLVPVVGGEVFASLKSGSEGFQEKLQSLLIKPSSWFGVATVAAVVMAVYCYNIWQVYRRSKALRQSFREGYTALFETQTG